MARDEALGRIVTAQPHEVYAHGRLDQRGEVPAGADRQHEVRDGDAEYLDRCALRGRDGQPRSPPPSARAVMARPMCFGPLMAETPNRSRMLRMPRPRISMCSRRRSGALPTSCPRTAAAHFHQVVGDEPVAAHDQVERALALADARLALDEHAETVEVEQHAVALLARGERLLKILGDGGDGGGADERRLDEREAGRLARLDQLGGRRQPLGDEDAGDFLELQTARWPRAARSGVSWPRNCRLRSARRSARAPRGRSGGSRRARGRASVCAACGASVLRLRERPRRSPARGRAARPRRTYRW